MFTVFTPTHDPRHLAAAYQSLVDQTRTDWEWIVVLNNGAQLPPLSDPRVKVFRYDHRNVGALKAFACAQASGEWLVELDHDDELAPTCLEEIARRPEDFVYSNTVRVDDAWQPVLYGETFGWRYRGCMWGEHPAMEVVAPEPWPSNLSRIWFAPDHVRAWRRRFYENIGGHNPDLHVCDDHDLICRTALAGTIGHIDKPLYAYHIHGDNTWLANQDEITAGMWANHDRYFIGLAEKDARARELALVDLGGALDAPAGYVTLDRHDADYVCDLNGDWPLEADSVGVLRAHDIFEHLRDPIHAMNEAYRVLVHGGVLDLSVPSTAGEGAFCDPTHVSFWNRRSLRYYTEGAMRRYLEPECVCRFQIARVTEPAKWEGVPYVEAHLLAVKAGARLHGEVLI